LVEYNRAPFPLACHSSPQPFDQLGFVVRIVQPQVAEAPDQVVPVNQIDHRALFLIVSALQL
jgi:hypothetical protein